MILLLRRLAVAVAAAAAAGAAASSAAKPSSSGSNGVHLSIGNLPGDMVVSWSTEEPGQVGAVRFGRSPSQLTSVVQAASSTLANNEVAAGPYHAPAPWRNISVHHATIPNPGIAAGMPVFYQVFNPAETPGARAAPEQSITIFNYTAGKLPHGRPGPVSFAVFGDLAVKEQDGANYTLSRLKQHLRQGSFDAVLHVGDVAYDLRQNLGRTGDEFLQDMEPVASAVPYLTCPGNHERDCVNNVTLAPEGSCGDPQYTNYRARFAMPRPAPFQRRAPLHWSATIGHAHVISLNTDLWILPGKASPAVAAAIAEQLHWLEADLKAAAANRQQAPWLIVIGHEMLYTTHDAGHQSQAAILRASGLERLFHDYGVDLFFSGHEHVYEHFARIYQGAPCTTAAQAGTKCGLLGRCPCTAYIVVGNAGNREFPYHDKAGNIVKFAYPQPTWEHFRSTSPAGFGLLDVPNASTIVWRQFNARTGGVIDSHVYHRSPTQLLYQG